MDWAVVYTKDSDIQTLFDLNGMKVAVDKKSFTTPLLENICKKFGVSLKLVYVPTAEDILVDIANNKVDAGVILHNFGLLNAHKYDVKKSPIIFAPIGKFVAAPQGKHSGFLDIIDKQLMQ